MPESLPTDQSESVAAPVALGAMPSPLLLGIGGPLFLFLLALFLFCRPLILLGDGGTCRHFLTGIYILDNHAVPVTNYMSALEANAPWVTHELLCDLVFGIPFPFLGIGWVVLISSIAIALAFAWSYQMARYRGAGLLASLLLLVFSVEACTIHWSARPHLFTYLLFLAAFNECFVVSASLRRRCISLSVILFLWGNLHGSFALAIMMIGMRAVGDFAEGVIARASGNGAMNHAVADSVAANQQNPRADSAEAAEAGEPPALPVLPRTQLRQELSETSSSLGRQLWSLRDSLLVMFCALLAASCNLRGASFLNYVVSYLLNPKIQFHSDEWRSLDFSFGLPVWSFLLLCFALLAVWVYSRVKPRLGEFLFVAAMCCASIYAMRLVPYFALIVLPALAPQIAWFSENSIAARLPVIGRLIAVDKRASLSELKSSRHAWVFSLIALVFSAVFLFVPASKIQDFDPLRMPVAASDYMIKNKISGLGFTKDNWGSYLYWKLKEPIFLDDKTDFYSQKLLDDYMSIFMSKPGWQQALERYKFAYILIPPGLPLQFDLAQSKNWKCAFQDSQSVLFVRQ